MVRSNSGKDGGWVTSILGLDFGLDSSDIRSRLNSLSVGALGLGHIFGRCDGLGDCLGLLDLDSLWNTRWSALGRLGSVTGPMTESSLIDGLSEW